MKNQNIKRLAAAIAFMGCFALLVAAIDMKPNSNINMNGWNITNARVVFSNYFSGDGSWLTNVSGNANATASAGNITNLWTNASDQQTQLGNLWTNASDQQGKLGNLFSNDTAQELHINNLWINASSQEGKIKDLYDNASAQETHIKNLWTNASDQQAKFGFYLPLAGGRMAGDINMSSNDVLIETGKVCVGEACAVCFYFSGTNFVQEAPCSP